jgi:hypothetical protein
MKKIIICTCAWLVVGIVTGQNLVPNSSFEEHKTCDFVYGAIDTNFIASPVVSDWASATYGGTPDYFHQCQLPPSFPSDNYNVPKNINGFQKPLSTGMAYSGISLIYRFSSTVEAREFIQSKLNKRLESGKRYCAGYYTSYANQDSAIIKDNATLVAPTQWGMLLSTTRPFNATDPFISPTPPTAFYLPGTPQITTTGAITDTANWVLVADTYTATGGEEWLTIGNFNPIGQTALDTFYNAHDFAVSSYYYIDNVFVIPMDDGGLLPGDTAICAASFPLQLSAFDGFTGYAWANGDTTRATAITGPGTYTIMANYAGCQIVDTMRIAELPPPVLDLAPVHYCADDLPTAYTVPANQGFDQFVWPDGTTGPTVTIRGAGELIVSANGGCGSDTAALVVGTELPLVVDLGDNLNICAEGQLQEVVLGSTGPLPNYLWSTGQATPEIATSSPGVYSLVAQNACGSFQDEVVLAGCEPSVYVPNVFYPSSLYAENYLFRPFAVNASIESMEVFDRWGGKMYFGEGNAAAWDGSRNGEECSQGVYAYLIRYKNDDGKADLIHGDVLLIR